MISYAQDMFKSARRKMRPVAEGVKAERLSICKTCEHYTHHGQCMQCGCYMPLKVRFAGSECPINKWSAEDAE